MISVEMIKTSGVNVIITPMYVNAVVIILLFRYYKEGNNHTSKKKCFKLYFDPF
jgi:hypothetical protein